VIEEAMANWGRGGGAVEPKKKCTVIINTDIKGAFLNMKTGNGKVGRIEN